MVRSGPLCVERRAVAGRKEPAARFRRWSGTGRGGLAVTVPYRGVSLGTLVWIIVGVVVALSNGYNTITNFSSLISFLLSMFLWPLVLLGINLHVAL